MKMEWRPQGHTRNRICTSTTAQYVRKLSFRGNNEFSTGRTQKHQ